MKKKLSFIFALSSAVMFLMPLSFKTNKSIKQLNAQDINESALNELKSTISRTFSQDTLPVGTEAGAVLTHQNYSNENFRRQNVAKNQNIFLVSTNYNLTNTSLNNTSHFAGNGCYERINTEGMNGLAVRANSESGYMNLGYTGDYSINFFLKNNTSSYYSGLYSFRASTSGSILYNVDIGSAGFWLNPVSTSDSSDNTYRKYVTSSTSAWAGRTTYNGFTNNSFQVSTNADGMNQDEWYMITYTFSDLNGVSIYRNGVKKVTLAPSCKLVTNNGDTDNFTAANIVQILRTIMTTKNSRLMFFRGQSSSRPVGVCTDELTIFQKELTSEDMLLWMNSYKTVSYMNSGETIKVYRDVVNNLTPTVNATSPQKTFYYWASEEKLLNRFIGIISSDDINVYANFKDEEGVSDGAKILASDIEALDTCSDYDLVNSYLEKIELLDNVDTSYVLNYQFIDSNNQTYTIEEKLDYMLMLNEGSVKSNILNIKSIFDVSNSDNLIVLVVIVTLVSAFGFITYKLLKSRHNKTGA